jgi:RIO-like serine/threonine protein kinase
MMSLKSMGIEYCCLTELESKGLFSTCSEFIMYIGKSIDVYERIYSSGSPIVLQENTNEPRCGKGKRGTRI